ncbi:DUF6527 family protein [Bradyrhizobium sp. CCGUVB4N]|uniref:DUF6527 family protein n=1 Tax=Bradyrhizobium sp. CCGUVB4N TaxID=2949631 RepID=UPI0020B36E46|nr:DUF6527 family protein [Bradyrhizobium sp. CCGUVB4N]MCP3385931.1 DUF6527 family protein [Bradyrhizobium sp. CCGUVB4N]
MIRYSRLEHRFVDDMPERLDGGIIYVSMRYATVMHLCCCGCGREVVTPLAPAQWRLTFDGENVSLHPSIGSWNLHCRSHYVIRGGEVIEAPQWSDEEVARGQARDKRARTAHFAAKAGGKLETKAMSPPQAERKGWLARIGGIFTGWR